jgi:hypothetical protein
MTFDAGRRLEIVTQLLSTEAISQLPTVCFALMREVPDPRVLPEILAAVVASLPHAALARFEQVFTAMGQAIERAESGAANDPS